MGFPAQRPRRLRRTEILRSLVRETDLSAGDLVYPLFVRPGKRVRQEISSMPGQYNLSVDEAVAEGQQARSLGVPAVILFGIPPAKDAKASGAYDAHGIVQEAVAALKKEVRDLLVIADVCLCEYTDHGHCGVVQGDEILNDPTLEQFTEIFEMNCRRLELRFDKLLVEYLQRRYYEPVGRPFRCCHPRDLLEQVVALCRYRGIPPKMTRELIDRACAAYFVDEDREAGHVVA